MEEGARTLTSLYCIFDKNQLFTLVEVLSYHQSMLCYIALSTKFVFIKITLR